MKPLTPIIITNRLSTLLANVEVLHDVSLQIPQACWTSVIGPNGAGKSTLLKVIAGLLPDHNQVLINGQTKKQINPQIRARKIAWLGQNETISDDLLVYDLVMLGRLPHQAWLSNANQADHQAVKHALALTNTSELCQRPVDELSGGECQRVLIARALAVEAEILLLDEPLNNLDPPHQADMITLIRSLTASGTTVISVLHDITFALQAEQIIIIKNGTLLYQGATNEIQTHIQIEAAFEQRIKIFPLEDAWVSLPHHPTTPLA
ncbi:ABC transporter ATP-binding protein [Polynucleobacter sp. IMCC 29146]|uniref:ABC transporter ATP-binding protein n=1 Tax=Polynucleobacter sp. IMCC 29146 TaxID=2780953 RepID=UPI001F274A12|nr:ABC transporter ATP-binding protein [Polynucleobacter sp. IMCC 29146]MCE7529983.1 ABC transporter ATP-binding protein [Polynucleobacter sp. IMCC 29146]